MFYMKVLSIGGNNWTFIFLLWPMSNNHAPAMLVYMKFGSKTQNQNSVGLALPFGPIFCCTYHGFGEIRIWVKDPKSISNLKFQVGFASLIHIHYKGD